MIGVGRPGESGVHLGAEKDMVRNWGNALGERRRVVYHLCVLQQDIIVVVDFHNCDALN